MLIAWASQQWAAGGGGSELFPDPTLADVADTTNGWQFSNGFPSFGPEGGTGPGIQADGAFDDDTAALIGADDAAFAAAVTMGNTYTVTLTFANVSVSDNLAVRIGTGTEVAFAAANGPVSHDIIAGDPSGGQSWNMAFTTSGATFDITAISVTAA